MPGIRSARRLRGQAANVIHEVPHLLRGELAPETLHLELRTDGEVFATIRDGVGPKFQMKGFRSKLTPQEMWHLVNYVRSLAPQSSR